MREDLIQKLSVITEEEQQLRLGKAEIQKELYTGMSDFVIDRDRMLSAGRLIRIRTHTRFTMFPKHRHNYIEMVYQVTGETHHTVNDHPITLKSGEILIMNKSASQTVEAASEGDVAVNFIILPAFFDTTLKLMQGTDSALKDFLISSLGSGETPVSYLHFHVAGILPIENLMENLIASLLTSDERTFADEATMALLFIHLLEHTDRLDSGRDSYEHTLIFQLLQYIETYYRDCSLSHFAALHHAELTALSRMVKKYTGSTWQALVQKKRLSRACELLTGTDLSVSDIAAAVGYENFSFFHRLFKESLGMTPRQFRIKR